MTGCGKLRTSFIPTAEHKDSFLADWNKVVVLTDRLIQPNSTSMPFDLQFERLNVSRNFANDDKHASYEP
jgi:hypothetical protein